MNEFRHVLRRERMARGMSQDALGTEVHVSGSQIGNYEAGRSIPPNDVARALDKLLGTGEQLQDLVEQARGEAVAPWLRPWKVSERRAIALRWFEHSIIPGLLQTEAYIRAILEVGPLTPMQIEEMTRERLERQAATLDRPDPVVLTAILGEAALSHGPPTIMKEQLEHLLDVGHRPNVHVRVVPVASGLHAGLTGAFAIATLPDGASIVHLDELVEGKVASRTQDLRHAMAAWESICALALPCETSRALILKAIDSHDEQARLAQEQAQR